MDQKIKSPSSKKNPSQQFPPCIYLFFEAFFKQQGLKRPSSFWPLYRGGAFNLQTFKPFAGNFPLPIFFQTTHPSDPPNGWGETDGFLGVSTFFAMDMLWLHPRHWNGTWWTQLGGWSKKKGQQKKHEGFEPVQQG